MKETLSPRTFPGGRSSVNRHKNSFSPHPVFWLAAALLLAPISSPARAQKGEWAWMSGSSTVNHAGVYGKIGHASSQNVPGSRSAASTWVGRAGNFWLFGGLGMDSTGSVGDLNDLWMFDLSTREWTWVGGSDKAGQSGNYGKLGVAAPASVPGARDSAQSWLDGEGNLWLFGGNAPDFNSSGMSNTGTDQANDLWEFELSTRLWRWMGGSTGVSCNDDNGPFVCGVPGAYGRRGDSSTGNLPGGRSAAVTWTDSSGGLWLFGGFGYDSSDDPYDYVGSLNDLWKFDPTTHEWTWLSGSSLLPEGYGAAPGVHGKLGIPASANVPEGRSGASGWIDSDGNLWLFAGSTGSYGNIGAGIGNLNDLWKYEPASGQWTWMSGSTAAGNGAPGDYGVKGEPAAASLPGSRLSSVSWIDSDGVLWLFAGTGFDSAGKYGALNDLWAFNPLDREWLWVEGSKSISSKGGLPGAYGTLGDPAAGNLPGSRWGAATWTGHDGSFWLFGGTGFDGKSGSGDLNDLWRFEPLAIAWPAATPQFSLAAGSYNKSQTVTLTDITPGASIYYTLNGSTPSNKSTKYTAAIDIQSTTTVKAIATAPGLMASLVASARYTVVKPAVAEGTLSPAR
jgi:hypothetical protein